MKLKDRIVDTYYRGYRWFVSVDWIGITRKIMHAIDSSMHTILFNVLLPKRFRTLKKREIFEIIFKSDTPVGKKFDIWLLVIIVANIVLLIVDSLTGTTSTITAHAEHNASFWIMKVLEWAFTIIFTFEYYLRIYCLKHPIKYVTSFWGIIDFFSIFPAYLSIFVPATQALTVLRLLRVMRIFRIFKLRKFQEEVFHLMNALRHSVVKILIFMMFLLIAAVILGTLMYAFESRVNPVFNNIPTGIYWAVVTITTVGYGDVAPVTAGGRLLAVLVMLLGYSIIAVPTGIVAGETVAEYRQPMKKFRSKLLTEIDKEEEDYKEEDYKKEKDI